MQTLLGFLVDLRVIDRLLDVDLQLLQAKLVFAGVEIGLALIEIPVCVGVLPIHQTQQSKPLRVFVAARGFYSLQFVGVAERNYRSACGGAVPVEILALAEFSGSHGSIYRSAARGSVPNLFDGGVREFIAI